MKKLAFLFLVLTSTIVHAQDDFSETFFEEPANAKLEWSGSFDVDYSVFWSRQKSLLYQVQYYNQNLSDILMTYPLEFYLNGDYQTKDIGVHLKTYSEYTADNHFAFSLFELYGSVNLFDSSYLLLGKKRYNWGKGYAFNPAGYVNPKKAPENPELANAGVISISFEYSKSFQSNWIQNFAFDLIILPSQSILNNMLSEIENTALAAKLYVLLWDTDVDLMSYYYGNTSTANIGMDFSRNIIPSVEIHGELSFLINQPRYIISGGALMPQNIDGASYLLGLRWLNQWNITTILEYYHNDAGLRVTEYGDYSTFLSDAVASNDSGIISDALNVSKTYFSGSALMQDYLYLKISWPEPFNLVDFAASAFIICNINDSSLSIGIPLEYQPITNLEILFQPTFLIGNNGTEFGSKQYLGKMQIQASFFF